MSAKSGVITVQPASAKHVTLMKDTTYLTLSEVVPDVQEQNVREWRHDKYSCCDDLGECCYAFWCYCCFQWSLADKLEESCLVPVCCGRCGVSVMRTKLRAMTGIQGSICGDCVSATFCEICVAVQMMRELRYLDSLEKQH